MNHRIHIFGASGSGTSTLGAHLAKEIGGYHLDTDSYYWHKSEPPYTLKREPSERINMIEHDIQHKENWVLSGSICSWGEPLLHHFTLVVFLYLDPSVRMARIFEREQKRYGDRILPGGDLRDNHLEFMSWAVSYDYAKAPIRSFDLHERWMPGLTCPIMRLNSDRPVEELCNEILNLTSATVL